MLCSGIDDDFRINVSLVLKNLLSCLNLLDRHDSIIVTYCYRQIPFDVCNILRDCKTAGMGSEKRICQRSTIRSFCLCIVSAELDGV